ncbi:MAG: hypothetical protein KDK65_00960 [Chlamydiia bacterium]|nr:hypothetical protein [Chlamydiia bacterium]
MSQLVHSVKGSRVDALWEMTGVPAYYGGRRFQVIEHQGKTVNFFDCGKIKFTRQQKMLAVALNVTIVFPLSLLLIKMCLRREWPKETIRLGKLKRAPLQGIERDLQREKGEYARVPVEKILENGKQFLNADDQAKLEELVRKAQNPREFGHIAAPNYHPLKFPVQEVGELDEVYCIRLRSTAEHAVNQIQIDAEQKRVALELIGQHQESKLVELKVFLDLQVKHCFAYNGRVLASEELQVSLKKIATLLPTSDIPKRLKEEKLQELAQSVDVCSPTWVNLADAFCRLLEKRTSWEEVILEAIQAVKEDYLLGIVQQEGNAEGNDDHWNGLNELREGALGPFLGLNYRHSHLDNTHHIAPNPRLAPEVVLEKFYRVFQVDDLIARVQQKINERPLADLILLKDQLTPTNVNIEDYFDVMERIEIKEWGVKNLLRQLKITKSVV